MKNKPRAMTSSYPLAVLGTLFHNLNNYILSSFLYAPNCNASFIPIVKSCDHKMLLLIGSATCWRVNFGNQLYSSSIAEALSDNDSIDHRRWISSNPSTDSRRDDPEGTVCRVLECLSSLLLRAACDS
jgi:hypothetical protein